MNLLLMLLIVLLNNIYLFLLSKCIKNKQLLLLIILFYMEDNISLVTGAKKEKIPNYDKNNFNLCISNFSRLALGIPPSQIKDNLINLSINVVGFG